MKIDSTSFEKITVDGIDFDHDVVIFPDCIKKRKKWISKEKYGTSRKFTRDEMSEYLGDVKKEDIDILIVGTGQYGKLGLMDEAKELLEEENIEFRELKTPEAIEFFNENKEPPREKIGIFHVTC